MLTREQRLSSHVTFRLASTPTLTSIPLLPIAFTLLIVSIGIIDTLLRLDPAKYDTISLDIQRVQAEDMFRLFH